MRGDEGDLEAADEEAGDQQQVAAMREAPRAAPAPIVCSNARPAALPREELPRSGIASTGIDQHHHAMMTRLSDQP